MVMVVVGSNDSTDARTGVVTRTPILRDLEDVRSETVERLQQSIRDHVDAALPQREREALAALLQKTTIMRLLGAPVDEGASLGLAMALAWAEGALVLGEAVGAACLHAETVLELEGVTVDLKALGDPPSVSAGAIAVLLRGGA